MQVFYTDPFPIPLPEGHAFPLDKYQRVREGVAATPEGERAVFSIANRATQEDLLLAHESEYIAAIRGGTLSRDAERRLGFPWSEAMVERSLRSCGSTVAASDHALEDGAAVYLGGGTHHAFRDRGGGFCVFNDCAVASLRLIHGGRLGRVLILDLDVHQGDGTASILRDEPRVFTFSMHGAKNYPRIKEPGDLDVALPDGCDDRTYLETLDETMDRVFELAQPELVFYLAGADPHRDDRFGRLGLTENGLAARDRRVFQACRERSVPVVVTMAGGYGRKLDVTVAIQIETVRQALAAY
ncbi:MAG: histone deacetylase [Planctomycetota bacterium]